MEWNCPDCERDATYGARFCRTCGARLAPEAEVTADTTRRYSPEQVAAAQSVAPRNAESSNSSQPTGQPVTAAVDTARFYHAPVHPHYNQVSDKPRRNLMALWIILALFLAMIIGGGVILFTAVNRVAHRPEVVKVPSGGIPEGVPGGIPHPPNAPPAPPAPPAPGEASLTVEQLQYPGATIVNNVSIMGQRVTEMKTSDDIAQVSQYYQKLLGNDGRIENRSDGKIVFLKEGPSTIVVSLESFGGATKITAVLAGLHSLKGMFGSSGEQPPPAPPASQDIQRLNEQIRDAQRKANEDARRAGEEARRAAEEARRAAEAQRRR